MNYPEFGHFGFKILAFVWGIQTISYMGTTIRQREEKNRHLGEIANKLKNKSYP